MRSRRTTAALILMFRLLAISFFLLSLLPGTAASDTPATPANQLVVAGNACGPAALLNAFRFGNQDWQRSSNAIAGDTDKQRIYTIIREFGMRPSNQIKGHPRWSKKGVNLTDLCDIANEMSAGKFLPSISREVLFLKPGETQEKLLVRVRRCFETSLAKGLPPVISLRRYTKRSQNGKPPEWIVLDAHFVTLTAILGKLEKNSQSFPVSYIDPWGGKFYQGKISIPSHGILADAASNSPCLEAVFPQSSVGRKLLRPEEPEALTIAAVLGRW